MIFVTGVALLVIASIEARESPKIQIYEIRDKNNNGIELKDLSAAPTDQRKVETQLLRLLNTKKQKSRKDKVSQKLIDKLTSLRGDEGNRIGDDSYIYILEENGSNDNKDSSSNEEGFEDKTRNEQRERRLRNILEKLLRQSQKRPKRKRINRIDLVIPSEGIVSRRSSGLPDDRIKAPYPSNYEIIGADS